MTSFLFCLYLYANLPLHSRKWPKFDQWLWQYILWQHFIKMSLKHLRCDGSDDREAASNPADLGLNPAIFWFHFLRSISKRNPNLMVMSQVINNVYWTDWERKEFKNICKKHKTFGINLPAKYWTAKTWF